MPPRRDRNDVRQYADLAGEWWRPGGLFTVLHWLAAARAELIPPAPAGGGILVDLGAGGGLLAPHVSGKGYRHVGLDLVPEGLALARDHGVTAIRADVNRLPLRERSADVVVAGELLEHVTDPHAVVAEAARILKPGGRLVLDTLNRTALARLIVVTIGERGRLKGIHDPALFVEPQRLQRIARRVGIRLAVRGVRPAVPDVVRWTWRRDRPVRLVKSAKAVLYQGVGIREGNV